MWIKAFTEYLRCEKNRSARTVEAYVATLEDFATYFQGLDEELTWGTVTSDIVRQWVASKMERGYSARTVCRDLSALRTFYKYLLRSRLVESDPVHSVQGPKVPKCLPQFVREADMDRLLDGNYFPPTCEGLRDRLILLTFYSTGIRLSELVGLNWGDIDLVGCMLKVTGKRDKQRIVPFGGELQEAFRLMREALTKEGVDTEGDAPVFVSMKRHSRIGKKPVQEITKAYLSQVTTISRRSPHVLRHTFATAMLNHHADLRSVKELLGHERITTTEIYTHTSFEELRELYRHAHPRE